MIKFHAETLKFPAIVAVTFILAGSIAPHKKANALPVVTSNSAEFKNDINIGGGLDAVTKNQTSAKAATTGIYSYVADSPRNPMDTTITPTTDTTVFGQPGNIHTHGVFGYTATAPRVTTDHVIRDAVPASSETTRETTSEAYLKLSKKIGQDATIGAIYYKNAPAAELAVRNGNLALAAGYQFGDRSSITGSAAYSIGSVSPFAAYRDRSMHYGAELQLNSNSAIQIAYRPDGNQYSAGLRLDLGTSPTIASETLPIVEAPAPTPTNTWCANGYTYNWDFGGCAKKIAAPTQLTPPAPPNITNIRGRG